MKKFTLTLVILISLIITINTASAFDVKLPKQNNPIITHVRGNFYPPVECYCTEPVPDDPSGDFMPCGCPRKIPVYIDIWPGQCPNEISINGCGVVPIAILGTQNFDVRIIKKETIKLTRTGVDYEVEPIWTRYEDAATPFNGQLCDCHDLNGDGIEDLLMFFDLEEIAQELELGEHIGGAFPLKITAMTERTGFPKIEREIYGFDCVNVITTPCGIINQNNRKTSTIFKTKTKSKPKKTKFGLSPFKISIKL